MCGTWDVEMTLWPRPGGPGLSTKATSTIRAALRRAVRRGEDRRRAERRAVHDAGVDRLQQLHAPVRGDADLQHQRQPHRRERRLRGEDQPVRAEGGLPAGRRDLAPAHRDPAALGRRDDGGQLPELRKSAGVEGRGDQIHAQDEVAARQSRASEPRDPRSGSGVEARLSGDRGSGIGDRGSGIGDRDRNSRGTAACRVMPREQ